MNERWSRRLLTILRILLGMIFLYAAIGKIIKPAAFAADIEHYRLLPYFLVPLLAAVLPWIELSCGLLMIAGRWLPGATLLVMMMNLVFMLAIGSAMIRGLDISCGCFSLSSEPGRVGLARLLEDAGFLIAAFLIYRNTEP